MLGTAAVADRQHIPTDVERAVLVEAGHRCAIPTCRQIPVEIAHIVPHAQTQDDSFENLIALCPTCHARFDRRKEIDRRSMMMYKRNLGILNSRYCDFELRFFEHVHDTGKRIVHVGPGMALLLRNAERDGLISELPMDIDYFEAVEGSIVPMLHMFLVSSVGMDFIRQYFEGRELD